MVIMRSSLLSVVSLIILASACNNQKEVKNYVVAEDLHSSMQHLTDVIVHDIFSPPVASRIYAYASIAPYEILALNDSSYRPLAGQLTDLSPIPLPEKEISDDIAALNAHYIVAKQLIFSEEKIEVHRQEWLQRLKEKGISRTMLENSLAYGEEVAGHILRWSSFDNYKETRTFQKFTISNVPHRWQPTPPAYMEAIEPHWNKIRPFVIDSATQFIPERPTPFSMNKNSDFYKEVMEVYETSKSLDKEKSEIASFWDCNPYVMNVHGHVMFATKKITPGGHWIGIAKIASQLSNADLMKASAAYSLTAIALADAFISCWDEKYKSNLIRPETVINRYIDEEWQPLLQTPPFPEYTSGHSVISNAAAIALTSIFGESFAFTDSTEVKYGLASRNFSSFTKAADEAAISRLYGGIHYMPAIENGAKQGRELGEYVIKNVQLKIE
jgi:hypothetical protein